MPFPDETEYPTKVAPVSGDALLIADSENGNEAKKILYSAIETAIEAAVDAVVAAAPGALDTLNELAASLGDDPNFATTVTNSLATKATAVDLSNHTGDSNNPHAVTPNQIGAYPLAGYVYSASNATLTAATHGNKSIGVPNGVVLSLDDAATFATGAFIFITCTQTSGSATVNAYSGQSFGNGSVSSLTVKSGETLIFKKATNTRWFVIGSLDLNGVLHNGNLQQFAIPKFSATVNCTSATTAEINKLYVNTQLPVASNANCEVLTLPTPAGNAGAVVGAIARYDYDLGDIAGWYLSGHINGVNNNTTWQSGNAVSRAWLLCDGTTWNLFGM